MTIRRNKITTGELWAPSRRQFLITSGLAVSAVGLAACSDGEPSSNSPGADSTPKRGGHLIAGLLGAGVNETLDPAKAVNEIDEAACRQIYATLTRCQGDFSAAPYLAESLTADATGSQWTLKLRSGVTFHDGKPLTVDDVLYTFRRVADPETASGGAPLVSIIDFDKTKRVSDTQLDFVLKEPKVDWDQSLYLRETSIIQEGTTDFRKPVGTGPFELVKWTPGQRSEYKRFDNFFEDGKPYLDELTFISIEDGQARLNALLGGQVMLVNYLDATQARVNEDNPKIELLRSSPAHCLPIVMNMNTPEFADVRVRQAMRLAIDRPATLTAAYSGFGEVGNDQFGMGTALYNSELPQREYDPDQARSLLREAGKEGMTVEFPLSGLPAAALAFAQQAKEAGFNIETVKYPLDQYYEKVYMKAPVFESDWSGPWNNFAALTHAPGAAYNETGINDPQLGELIKKAAGTSDFAARKALYADMAEIEYDRGGYLIFGYMDNTDAISPQVKGIDPKSNPNRLAGYFFSDAYLA